MSLIRSPLNNFDVVDLTSAVRNVPIQYGTFNQLGIFREESVQSEVVVFEETTVDGALLVDRVRGEKPVANKGENRKLHSFIIPYFPDVDYISPKDLQNKSAYDNFNEVEVLEQVTERKLMRMRQNHDWTLNKARAQALFSGTAYAPAGTISQDWFSEFGATRQSVDFTFGTSTTEVLQKIEQVLQLVRVGMGGNGIYNGIIVPCDTGFFSRLITHPSVKAAWTYQQQNQVGLDPIRGRLAAGGSPLPAGREFYFGGVTFREVVDAYNGVSLTTANEGVAVPTGSDKFATFFSPAERFGLVNTYGEKMYAFQQANPDNTQITLSTESNHISALLRPNAVIRVWSSN